MHKLWFMAGFILLFLPTLGVSQTPTGAPDRSLPWVTSEVKAPRVVFQTFDSKKVGVKISFHAYIPDTYNKIPDRLPVLYWLHGTEGGVSGIPVLARFFDQAMTIGKMPAMLVVFVNGLPRRLWADSKDGSSPVETVFITELIPHIDQTFRTISSKEGRILEGFSMGGYGAARLGFKYPNHFAGISILAGGPFDLTLEGPRAQRNPRLREQLLRDVCGNDLDYFKSISPWMLAETAAVYLRTKPTLIRQAVGSLDNTRELSHEFHIRMRNLAIAHEYLEYPNIDHDALALLEVLARTNGDFYYRALGRTQTSRKLP